MTLLLRSALIVSFTTLCGCGGEAPNTASSTANEAEPNLGAEIEVHVSGADSLNISGHSDSPGSACGYYLLGGMVINTSSASFPGTGSWHLSISGDSPSEASLLLSLDDVIYAANNAANNSDASVDQDGILIISDDAQHATFDLPLANVINHEQKVRVKGSIDCN
ncbi:MAG: hypothetical protein LBF16_08885 [Pseudomonadales bacterium]|jgi:hypothetical protein|nr:hypothetical protein [Pseudomonadales bacterium]